MKLPSDAVPEAYVSPKALVHLIAFRNPVLSGSVTETPNMPGEPDDIDEYNED